MNTLSVAGRAGTIAQQAARADAAAWGQALEATTRTIAALAAVTYVLGEALGRWVHATSAVLGQLHACLLVGHERTAAALDQIDAATDAFVETVVERDLPAYWDLLGMTVVELRRVARQQGIKAAGGRRVAQARRDDLLMALGA